MITESLVNKGRVIKLRLFHADKQMVSISAQLGNNVFLEGRNSIGSHTKLKHSSLGYGSYVGSNCDLQGCKIGRYCSIASNVKCIKGSHPLSFVSTHPAFYKQNHPCKLSFVKSDIYNEYHYASEDYLVVIGNDVWIGENASIMNGITIGDGAVIAAGALVTKNIPPYAIVGGIPAKTIRFRFDPLTIKRLMNCKWWDKPIIWIRKHADSFLDVNQLLSEMENSDE